MGHHRSADASATTSQAEARLHRCRVALWNEQARKLVVADRRPSQILDTLVEAGHLGDAIRFFAMVLPEHLGIWWGTLCAWNAYGGELPHEDLAAMEATLCWLRDPGEANRRAAEAAGNRASVRTPAGALAMAAFMSGGNVSRPHLPYVSPSPQASGRLVAGAILLAAVLREPLLYRERYHQYLSMGIDVADGRLQWLAAPPSFAADDGFQVDRPHPAVPAPHFSVGKHHGCTAAKPAAGKTRHEGSTSRVQK